MSSLRSKLASALPTSRNTSPTSSPRASIDDGSTPSSIAASSMAKKKDDPERYRLLVTAGPSYDTSTHKIVQVNTSTPTLISNEFINAKIKVRIRGYRGLPSESPSTSPYFSDPLHVKDQYSIAFSFIPKQDIPSKDVVWGNDFDHPVRDRLPPGVNTAFRIVKEFVDPGLEMDAYADEPYLLGPALSCWFGFRVGDKVEDGSIPEQSEENDVLREGADGSGTEVRQNYNLPENNEKRRKHFLNRANREAFNFEKGRLYSADFYNPYLDFGNFALKLPGFSIKVIKYIDDKSHTLRYVFKNRTTGDVYFCVNMNLLWGEQLEKALKEDEELLEKFAGVEAGGESSSGEPETSGDEVAGSETHMNKPDLSEDEQFHASNTQAETGVLANSFEAEPGMKDKPDELRKEIQQLSISDLLLATSTSDRRGMKGPILDELD